MAQHCMQYCAKLHRVSTPEIVTHHIAEVESCATSATLRATTPCIWVLSQVATIVIGF